MSHSVIGSWIIRSISLMNCPEDFILYLNFTWHKHQKPRRHISVSECNGFIFLTCEFTVFLFLVHCRLEARSVTGALRNDKRNRCDVGIKWRMGEGVWEGPRKEAASERQGERGLGKLKGWQLEVCKPHELRSASSWDKNVTSENDLSPAQYVATGKCQHVLLTERTRGSASFRFSF